ncbi:AI-2E family transporter, partial [Peptostreptococcus stomatis]
LLSQSIEIHPMLVLVAIIAGEKVGGFAGMIVAVPFAALLKIWFERLVERRAKSRAREDIIPVAESVCSEGLEE